MNFYPVFMNAQQETQEQMEWWASYYSVEFSLNAPHPVYQFKLRRSDQNALFFLVKDNSSVLSQLKVGHVMPMKYYSDEALRATKVHKTHIHEIVNETRGRFKGHCRIKLEIVQDVTKPMLQ